MFFSNKKVVILGRNVTCGIRTLSSPFPFFSKKHAAVQNQHSINAFFSIINVIHVDIIDHCMRW